MTEKERTFLHVIGAIIVLPGTAVVLIPGILVWQYGFEAPHPYDLRFWLAKPLIPGGLALAGWTAALFFIYGEGSPAPWHPPHRLVVRGPYKFVRNPMIAAVLMLLAAEALLFNSDAIALWGVLFFVLNTLYFIYSEEPALEQRFGDYYRLYTANVSRWLPRLSAWHPPWEDDPSCDED